MSRSPAELDPRARRVLKQFVETDALLGLDAVPLARRRPEVAAPPPPPPDDAPEAPEGRRPAAPPAATSSPPEAARLPEPENREAKLRLLTRMDEDEVQSCTKCGLCASRTQTVFGEGDPDAPILFVGEGTAQPAAELGRPFVGRAGQLLDKMIAAMGYPRESVYIANVVKCRPPGNRPPQPDEVEACRSYLLRQVAWIRPEVIVTLGGPAAKLILGTKEGITRLRGTWATFDEVDPPIPVMPTFHPAYLLRNYTPDTRRKVWSDLLAVLQRLGVEPPPQGTQ